MLKYYNSLNYYAIAIPSFVMISVKSSLFEGMSVKCSCVRVQCSNALLPSSGHRCVCATEAQLSVYFTRHWITNSHYSLQKEKVGFFFIIFFCVQIGSVYFICIPRENKIGCKWFYFAQTLIRQKGAALIICLSSESPLSTVSSIRLDCVYSSL